MSVTIRSEIRVWHNASRIEDCTQNYLTIPKKLISDAYTPEAGSVVLGKVVGVSTEQDEEISGGGDFSAVVKDMGMTTRLITGTERYDYLFIFEKDWKRISKKFTVPGSRFLTVRLEHVYVGKKKTRLFHGNSVYWEESHGPDLQE